MRGMKIKAYFCMKIAKRKQKKAEMKGKWTVFAVVMFCALVNISLNGCGGQATTNHADAYEAAEDSATIDSILQSEDTFALDNEPITEPLAVVEDELFNDFVFKFDQSARLQRARVRFPLSSMDSNGEEHTIERADWRHHSMFLGQDFCTVLWNSRQQMSLAEDSNVVAARVEQIYLHSRTVNAYSFERDSLNGQWMLTEIYDIPFEHTDMEGFFDFYRQFATDSVYQRQHVRNPLNYTTIDEDSEYEAISGTIDTDQWFEFAPEIPQDVITNINFGQTYPNPNRMVVQMRGLANGLQSILIFHRDISGRWQLTDYEN